MIVPVGKGKYVVKSSKGKNLSKPLSKKAAEKRLEQVEYFKNKKSGKKPSGRELIERGMADRTFI